MLLDLSRRHDTALDNTVPLSFDIIIMRKYTVLLNIHLHLGHTNVGLGVLYVIVILYVCQIGRPMNQMSPDDVDHLHKGYNRCECNHGTSGDTVPAVEKCPILCYHNCNQQKCR